MFRLKTYKAWIATRLIDVATHKLYCRRGYPSLHIRRSVRAANQSTIMGVNHYEADDEFNAPNFGCSGLQHAKGKLYSLSVEREREGRR